MRSSCFPMMIIKTPQLHICSRLESFIFALFFSLLRFQFIKLYKKYIFAPRVKTERHILWNMSATSIFHWWRNYSPVNTNFLDKQTYKVFFLLFLSLWLCLKRQYFDHYIIYGLIIFCSLYITTMLSICTYIDRYI